MVGKGKSAPVEDEGIDSAYIGETLLVVAFLVVALGMIAIPFAFYATYSGAMRWIITLALVTAAAIVAGRVLYPIGEKPYRERAPEHFGGAEKGRYGALAEMAERARQGYAYSQRSLNERMADAFLDKMRIRKGLDPGEVFKLSGDEAALGEACGDAELAAFVVKSKAAISAPSERRRFVTRREMGERGAAFDTEAFRFIERIEAWEG